MLHHGLNRRVPCGDTYRPNGFPIHFMCNGKALLCLSSLTKITFQKPTLGVKPAFQLLERGNLARGSQAQSQEGFRGGAPPVEFLTRRRID